MSRREFLRLATVWSLRAAVVTVGGATYTSKVEPAWLDVEQVRMPMPRLAPQFNGYRIVQISDIHMGDWMDAAHLAQVVAHANAQNPDLITITGDFITHDPEAQQAQLVTHLSRLRAKDGVVAVLGNHDHWHGPEKVREVLRATNIVELDNRVFPLNRGGELFYVAGIDDAYVGADRLDRVLDSLPSRGGAMLLAHEPDFADASAASGRFDLQISGHSHGGQVVLPLVGAPQLPEMGQKYPLGRYQLGDMVQYTNRGVGMVRPHVRFNCRPEITVFTLEAGRTAA